MKYLCLLDTGSERLPVDDSKWTPVEADGIRAAAIDFTATHLSGFGNYDVHVRPATAKPPCIVHLFTLHRTPV